MKTNRSTIILITGVPCAGKSSLSIKLNKSGEHLIVQETDIIRSAMYGYQKSLIDKNFHFSEKELLPKHGVIKDYRKTMVENDNFVEAFYQVILRQKRKGIPTIINGFNLMNTKISYFLKVKDLYFIYLHFNKVETIKERLKKRNNDVDDALLKQIDNIWEINNKYHDFLLNYNTQKNLIIIDVDNKDQIDIVTKLKNIIDKLD